MTADWSHLNDTYGPADAVPTFLDALRSEPTDEVWEELWSRLCHQGSVYPASFAALPVLAEIAACWPPESRVMLLSLAGAIIASDDVRDMAGGRPEIPSELLRQLEAGCRESLAVPNLDRDTFLYLLQADAAFRGDYLWARHVDRLDSGEFVGRCPYCRSDLYIVIGPEGCFTTADERYGWPESLRVPIVSLAGAESGEGCWMRDLALTVGQEEVASCLDYLLGSSRCPLCDGQFTIAEALAALDSRE